VAGSSIASISGNSLGPVTIDNRTLSTNYNIVDNNNETNQIWVRGGLEWALNDNLLLRSQIYGFTANRTFFNSETYSFDPASGLVDRDRFFVGHDQNLLGNKTQLQWDSTFAGKENRLVTAFEISNINFHVRQFDFTNAAFPADSISLLNPVRGTFGPLDVENFSTRVGDIALAVDDRLKVTPTFALIGGLRYEQITLDRNAANRPGYPYSQSWMPLTGRVGFTWEAIPGLTVFGQYATAADVAAANLFTLRPAQTQNLTTTRTYEGGVKQLFWERKAEWSFAGYHIERNDLPSQQSATVVNTVGQQISDGVEVAAAVRPNTRWNIWGNLSFMRAYYSDYVTAGGNLSGNTPPNVPKVVANAGASYRMNLPVPVEIGTMVRHVGDRFNADPNAVTMLAYTVADAYAFVDLKKNTRITFRVRNLTDKTYAVWADPGYPDQILLGAPRSYEVSAALKF
jgi:iron complex outermembrane receptor protein